MEYDVIALDNIDIKVEVGNLFINIIYLRSSPFHKNKIIDFHEHSGYELHLIVRGKGSVTVDEKTYLLEPGILYITGPGKSHKQIADKNDPMVEYCINFEILRHTALPEQPKDLQAEIKEISEVLQKTHFWIGKDIHNTYKLFDNIFDEIRNRYSAYYLSIQNYICQILINTARCYLNNKVSSYEAPPKNLDDKRRFIIDMYMSDYFHNMSISDLAEKVGLSVRQVNRILLKYYGMSFVQRITYIKMEKAKMLLVNTGIPIKEIAQKLGYDDAGYFTRIFKKIYNVTPSYYRKKRNKTGLGAY